MAAQKNPTNNDIFREVKEIRGIVDQQGKTIQELVKWKTQQQAIEAYVAKQTKNSLPKVDWTKIVVSVTGVVTLALTIVYAVVNK